MGARVASVRTMSTDEIEKLGTRRLAELLEDYIRDKRIIGEALGLSGDDALRFDLQMEKLDELKPKP
jgi:hypothetical protein